MKHNTLHNNFQYKQWIVSLLIREGLSGHSGQDSVIPSELTSANTTKTIMFTRRVNCYSLRTRPIMKFLQFLCNCFQPIKQSYIYLSLHRNHVKYYLFSFTIQLICLCWLHDSNNLYGKYDSYLGHFVLCDRGPRPQQWCKQYVHTQWDTVFRDVLETSWTVRNALPVKVLIKWNMTRSPAYLNCYLFFTLLPYNIVDSFTSNKRFIWCVCKAPTFFL